MSPSPERIALPDLDSVVEDQTAELEERSEALALILAVQEGLATSLDTEAIYELVGDRLRDFFDAQAVVIRTFDYENSLDHVRYVVEKNRRLYPPPRPITPLLQHLIDTRTSFLWKEDVARHLAHYHHPIFDDSEMPKSVLTVPMIVRDVVLGAASLQNVDREHAFDEEDQRLLTTLTCSMAQALEVAESHIRLRQTLDELQSTRDRLLDEQRLRAETAEALAHHLGAENERQMRELEDARQLQLSLLPQQMPRLAHADLAAFTEPATEVGGDYYDFDLDGDGTLTFAIGDATGHGARAGAMVTATKVLFASLKDEPDLAVALHKGNAILQRVCLPKLYMALALGRLCGQTLELAGAGMPLALVYRASIGLVEEVSLKGLPLGSPHRYPYRQVRVELDPSDVVLLMSDGLPELFDVRRDQFGMARVAEVFQASAGDAPQVVLDRLVRAGRVWRGDGAQEDDVTLVVLKVRPHVEA